MGDSVVLGLLRQRSAAAEPDALPETDALTGLPNRQGLTAALDDAVRTSRGTSSVAVLSFIEIGRLRDINDSFGADAGDRLLAQVARRLEAIDLPGTKVFRYEGAVFAVVFPNVPTVQGAHESARFLIEYLTEPFVVDDSPLLINPILGVGVSPLASVALDEMIRDTQSALRRARENGDAYVVHDESMRERYFTRLDEPRLRVAVDNDEFQLHYQPIVNLSTGQLVGVEALLRWDQPGATNTGMLYPNDFLPLLEKSGLIVELGEWTLHEACRQIRRWEVQHPDHPKLFVSCNIGPRQLADPGFTTAVASAIDAASVTTDQLCLDLTEAALLQNEVQRETSRAALRLLKSIGVQIGVGDFGAGSASLEHLRDYQVDILKMHRLFATGLGISGEDPLIFKHIAALAHDLNCKLVAEGVETDEQARLLPDLGVDYGQGFFFGRPQNAAQIDHLIGSIVDLDANPSTPEPASSAVPEPDEATSTTS